MDVRWYGCRLTDGAVLEELPVQSTTLPSRLGSYASGSVAFPIPEAPADWKAACRPRRTMLALALDDVIVWGARVVSREAGSSPLCSLGLATLESYLDWRFVGNWTLVATDEATIVSGLVQETNNEGVGFGIDAPPTGTLRNRTYLDQDDKTTYSALRELMGVEGGPEWTVQLGWADADHVAVAKTVVVRNRIGTAIDPPAAVFQTYGHGQATYRFLEDHSTGKAGNHVLATSSGEGDTRPQSVPARDLALLALEPRYEHRFTPSTSITTQSVLDAHARSKLAVVAPGGRVLEITGRFDAFPRLGVDWFLGDTIGYELYGHRDPDGLIGAERCIGWELDLARETVSPQLLVPGEEV